MTAPPHAGLIRGALRMAHGAWRMARPAWLLAQGRLAAGQIGEQVGYQPEAAFNRVFKRHHGVGPGEYRRGARAA